MVTPYMGRGRPRKYPPSIVPTHPLRTLVFVASGGMQGELELYKEDTYMATPYSYTEEPRIPLHESEHK